MLKGPTIPGGPLWRVLAALATLLAYLYATHAVGRYEGWGQWAAAPMLLAPLFAGLAVAFVAAICLAIALRRGRTWWPELLALLLASAPWAWLLWRNALR